MDKEKPRADEGRVVASPWMPEQDSVRLALLGKLLEELNEAGAIVARCIIQGIDEAEPVTGVVNRTALTDELADVFATARLVEQAFILSSAHMDRRIRQKVDHLERWHELIRICKAPPLTEEGKK